jgi:hypothetical protein
MNYGRIKLITSRKARAVTAGNTLHADGSLFNSFKVRMIKGVEEYQLPLHSTNNTSRG